MSFIEQQSEFMPLAVISGNSDMTAAGSLQGTARASIAGGSNFAAAARIALPGAAVIAGAATLAPVGRLNDEPNWFGASQFAGQSVLAASGSLLLEPYLLIAGQTTVEAAATVEQPETSTLSLIVDIIPAPRAGSYQEYDGWLKVNGVTVPIASAELDAPDDSAGMTLSATIANFSDRSLFVSDAAIEFLVSQFGAWTSVLTGKLNSKNYSFANANGAPNDTFNFSSVSTLNDRLARTPPTNLVIYDPAKVEIDADDYETIYDSAGRSYALSLFSMSAMSVHSLMTEVFVNRCGFSAVKTNLPNYPLKRADFSVSSSYLSGVSPHVGMFEPLIFPEGDVLWIIDATTALPNGFPAPRVLNASKLDGITGNQTIERIDGFDVQSVVSELGNFFTTRLKQKTREVGSFGNNNYTRTETVQTIREYRLVNNPQIVIDERIVSEVISAYTGNLSLIDRVTRNLSYDKFGRLINSTKNTEKLIPDLTSGTVFQIQTVYTEREDWKYSNHPFIPGKQIQSQYLRRTSGLMAIDKENQYFGEDFPQAFMKADEAGNLRPLMAYRYGEIETFVENSRPLRNGQVEVESSVTNFVPAIVGKPAIIRDTSSEPRVGDISLNGQSGKQNSIYVFPTDTWVRTNDPIVSFAVGELSLEIAIPLARRQLIRRRTKSSKVTATIIGLDLAIRRGAIYQIRERENNTVCKMIVEGFRLALSREKTSMTIRGREI